uniref:Uncharacterized protein n=1 Tax=Globodera rostochiensis TaxID=31243 RepID=A0A914H423_GLORO
MGSSSSSPLSALSLSSAKWTPVPPCSCGCQEYRAVQMEVRAHPMMISAEIIDSVSLGRSEPMHHAVLVYFVCGNCGKTHRRTYEISIQGTFRGWGYYRFYYKICCANTNLNVSYEKIEDVFRGMWTKYNLFHANCQHGHATSIIGMFRNCIVFFCFSFFFIDFITFLRLFLCLFRLRSFLLSLSQRSQLGSSG